MNARLQQSVRRLDELRRALLDELERLTEEELTAKPKPGKWSIIEIVEHLVLAEKDVLQGLPEPSRIVERKRTPKDRISYWIVLFVLKFRIPVKTPSRAMIPKGGASIADLRSRWDDSQSWLESYVESLSGDDLGKAVFSHPISGPLTPRQAIRLAQVHLDLHTSQIRRLQAVVR